MSRRVTRASAPVRADLAGGTLDLWPLGLLHPGAVTVAVAISLRVEASAGAPRRVGELELRSLDQDVVALVPRDDRRACVDPRLELLHRLALDHAPAEGAVVISRSPVRAGSGLGTSSALGVAALAALDSLSGRRRPRERAVARVRDVEARILGIPTGEQDHWAAVRGGLVVLHHEPAGPRVVRADAPLAALGERMLLVDSGKGRSSGPSNWDMFRRRIDGAAAARAAFDEIAAAGRQAAEALARADWNGLGRAMARDQEARAGLSPLVLTDPLRTIFRAARSAGAVGARVCGAGGGGFAVVLAEDPARRAVIAEAVSEAGGLVVDARPTRRGLVVRRV